MAPPYTPRSRPGPPDPRFEAAAEQLLRQARGRAQIQPAPRAGLIAHQVIRPWLKGEGATLAELKRRWPEIAGEKLAKLTEPEKLTKRGDGQVLTLKAAASAAPFVAHQKPLILERCALAGAKIVDVAIIQGPLGRKSLSNLRPVTAKPTPEQEQALAAGLASVEDNGLKDALMRLGRALISSPKD